MILHVFGSHVAMSPYNFQTLRLFLVVFSLLVTLYYIFSRPTVTQHDYHELYRVAVSGKKAAFVKEFLETEVDGPWDNTPLVELCKQQTWTPGLIMKCEAPQGGVANVRNVFLNCVRYAIEAGATAFIVPELQSFGTTAATLHTLTNVPFSHFFDADHFTTSLTTSCPQIRLIPNANDLWDKPSTAHAIQVVTHELLGESEGTVMEKPESWSGAFKSLLEYQHPEPFSSDVPVLASLAKPLLEFPLSYDDPQLVASFGRMIRFREDTRRLAATVLYAMSKAYGLDLDADAVGVNTGQFYGAHLRTEADATAAGWTPYEEQSKNYLDHASEYKLPVLYAASGNAADTANFTDIAGNRSISVTTKEELLAGKGYTKELKEMMSLTWDQRLLIDYEVLLRSSVFGGIHESTFSWNIALKRHGFSNYQKLQIGSTKNNTSTEHERRADEEDNSPSSPSPAYVRRQSFKDELSIVFGPPGEGKLFETSMWP